LGVVRLPKFSTPSSSAPPSPRPPSRCHHRQVHATVRPTFTIVPRNHAVPLLLCRRRPAPPPSPPSPSCFSSAISAAPGTKPPPPQPPPPPSPSPPHPGTALSARPSPLCQESCHPPGHHHHRVHLKQFSKPSSSLFPSPSINSLCIYDSASSLAKAPHYRSSTYHHHSLSLLSHAHHPFAKQHPR
jgi:hypothetical protein